MMVIFTLHALAKDESQDRSLSNNTADFVIVGGGTSGCVAARILSDNNHYSVVVLESGKNREEDPLFKYSVNAPYSALSFFVSTPFFETGFSVPQPELNNRKLPWAIAKLFGGASGLNAGYYGRGTEQFFSAWQAVAGKNWSPKKIIDTYKFLEHYEGKTSNASARGFCGLLNVRQAPEPPSALSQKATQAIMNATGVAPLVDYNDPKALIGASFTVQYTQQSPDGALRESSAISFLDSRVITPEGKGVDGRKLKVKFEAMALRTLWDGNKAIGVEYLHNGKHEKVYARKAVLVCAGFRSSTFLMHSGVGSSSLLNSLKIPVIVDNPNVGKNLMDQPTLIIVSLMNPHDYFGLAADVNAYLPYTAFLPHPTNKSSQRELLIAGLPPLPEVFAQAYQFINVKSRGTITIQSNNPLDPPIVDYCMLKDPADLPNMVLMLKVYLKKISQELAAIDPFYQLIFPDPSILTDDAKIADFIRNSLLPIFSFSGHCKMAPLDQAGVVDPTGKVHEVEGLYVGDVSVIPVPPDGVTAALAYMVGARIAHLLLGK